MERAKRIKRRDKQIGVNKAAGASQYKQTNKHTELSEAKDWHAERNATAMMGTCYDSAS